MACVARLPPAQAILQLLLLLLLAVCATLTPVEAALASQRVATLRQQQQHHHHLAEPPQGKEDVHNRLERFAAHKADWGGICQLGKHRECDVKLEYNTTELAHSGQWVQVSVSGVRTPKKSDLLAIYAPPDAYKRGAAPVKYVELCHSRRYLRQGEATVPVRLINLRVDMRAVFVRGGLDSPRLEVAGPLLENSNPNEPTGIHLFFGHRPSSMMVQWTTRDHGSPALRYGFKSGALHYFVPARSHTYTRDDMCGGPASNEGFLDPGQLHTAIMTGLPTNTRVFYSVGDEASDRWSEEHSFISNPGAGTHETIKILAAADQGVGEPDGFTAAMEYQPALEVQRLMDREAEVGGYQLYLMNGDLSYARGYGALWDTWLYQGRRVLTQMPMMTTPGNHEIDWCDFGFYSGSKDSGGECGVPYAARFPMPGAWTQTPWYSFEIGPLHFTVLSSEHSFLEGSPQHKFIEGDLAGVDRERTPWLVLTSHRPVYVSADDFAWPDGKQTTAIQLQTALEHMLTKYHVDVALSGHHHSYQRTCHVSKQKCRKPRSRHHHPGAPVYIVHGHAGASFYNNSFDPVPEWIDFQAQTTWGYLRMEVNGTSFFLQSINSTDGSVMDEVLLTRPQPRPSDADDDIRMELSSA